MAVRNAGNLLAVIGGGAVRADALIGILSLSLLGVATGVVATASDGDLPRRLHDTGLYADGDRVQAGHLQFSPQYPLWSDSAIKRRWISLPPGASIDASDVDAWNFPPGTRLWKEFGYGRPVETRMIERLADGSWRYSAYAWNADGRAAELVRPAGITVAVADAPGGRYTIPGRDDCRACHEGGAVPVLGFSALQLSPDRDPGAAHAESASSGFEDLRTLVSRGVLRNLPADVLRDVPRISAPGTSSRAALGYLHGNCGHCHNDVGPLAPMELNLYQAANTGSASWQNSLRTLIGAASRYQAPGVASDAPRVLAGHAAASILFARMRSRDPLAQMPPLGTHFADSEGLALIGRWINNDLPNLKEYSQ